MRESKFKTKRGLYAVAEFFDGRPDKVLWGTLAAIFIGYVLLHDLLGGTLLSYNWWDSYSLQAWTWLDGRIALDKNYEYLELAIYKGRYFVSFPPVPAILMIPWVVVFGKQPPTNIAMIIYVMITITVAYKCIRKFNMKDAYAMFWAVVYVLGSNMFWMSTMAGVWFQAQLVNMMFCTFTIWYMLNNKKVTAYIFLALAVGCRPYSALYFIPLFCWFYVKDRKESKKEGFVRIALKQKIAWIGPVIIAAAYMIYNYVRFDNIVEFGHNYLPEFTESENGQFSLSYLGTNLKNLLFRGVKLEKGMKLSFSHFDGFMFYIANPIFIILFIYIIRNILRREFTFVRISILLALVLNILGLCYHKTLGGWQFGARYTVDMIPFTLLYILTSKNSTRFTANTPIIKGKMNAEDITTHKWEIFIGAFAIMFNLYGIIYMHMNG